LKEIGKIVAYCAVVVVGGACLAPPLFWLGQWAVQSDIIPQLRPFGFEKYFNRAVLVLSCWLVFGLLLTGVAALRRRREPAAAEVPGPLTASSAA